jgi:hypothetical protein
VKSEVPPKLVVLNLPDHDLEGAKSRGINTAGVPPVVPDTRPQSARDGRENYSSAHLSSHFKTAELKTVLLAIADLITA